MGEKLHERLKEVLKVNNNQVNNVDSTAAGGHSNGIDGTVGLPENLLDKNLQEEMDYLSK